ncbi:MAG: hypothetical protein DYG88_11570 [Chloroflexi bacterium CFX4]|nr:hypothetical protein [Chloroflexi bacterium CFX4]MDL1923013.1 hypothetical protein [Chloroflexi bacterium CFX3]
MNRDEAFRRAAHTWRELQQAHHMMCHAEFMPAVKVYRRVLKKLRTYLDDPDAYPEWHTISDSEAQPSRNWLCVYLSEFYQHAYGWNGWRWLAKPILHDPTLDSLSLRAWSRFQSAVAWSNFRYTTLRHIERTQKAALGRLAGHTMLFEEALHHLVLTYVYQLNFHKKRAYHHAKEALARLSFETAPFYRFRALVLYNNTYRVFANFAEALNPLHEMDHYAQKLGVSQTPLDPAFMFGWSYIGRGDFAQARASFERAMHNAEACGMFYEQGRALFSLGNIVMLHDPYAAEKFVRKAIEVYFDNDHGELNRLQAFGQGSAAPHMIALCLTYLAEALKAQGKRATALSHVREAIAIQSRVDDPGPLYDLLLFVVIGSLRLMRLHHTLYYGVWLLWLHMRYPGLFRHTGEIILGYLRR